MPRWPSNIARAFPPLSVPADGHAAVTVVSRFGTLHLNRQVFAPVADAPHVMPGNALLPAHHGEIITRGLQELACLLPQDFSFASVERLLGWQALQEQLLSERTVRNLVRSHGQCIRQAEQTEVTSLLAREDLTTLRPQLLPAQTPRRRAAWPECLSMAVDQALQAECPKPPEGVSFADWERVLSVRRAEADCPSEELRTLGPEVRLDPMPSIMHPIRQERQELLPLAERAQAANSAGVAKNIRARTLARPALVLLWLLALLTAGCGQAPPPAPSSVPFLPSASQSYWPTAGWRTSPPQAQAMDPQKLALLLQAVRQEQLNLHSLLIIRNGFIVSETYFQPYTAETNHQVYSVTKSVMATLIGIAIDKRYIDGVNQPLTDFFRGYTFQHPDARKDAMTLEDVLTMRTGLDWQEQDATFRAIYQSGDWVQFILDMPMREPPGQQFRYCSGCSHLLSAIIERRTGRNTRDFAQQTLFEPLGIHNLSWEQDRQGIPIGGWGLQLTPREMAKLGYLYLHEGMWDGQRIVSAEWVKAVVERHTATDSQLGLDYGYQWWTYPAMRAYAALGRDGQTIFVVPELQLIIVTTAQVDGHAAIFKLIEHYILPAVSPA